MPNISTFSFEHQEYRYSLSLGWDDAALSDGKVQFDVTASGAKIDDPNSEHSITANVSIVQDNNHGASLVISVEGIEVFREGLSELFDEKSVVGKAMEAIPASLYGGHPLLGCLIRSGLSAVVGQILTCKNETLSYEWYWARVAAIGHCLRQNIPGMLLKTAYRSAKCIFRAGF